MGLDEGVGGVDKAADGRNPLTVLGGFLGGVVRGSKRIDPVGVWRAEQRGLRGQGRVPAYREAHFIWFSTN